MGDPGDALEQALPAALDRRRLHLFILGSGLGEAVLVALPKDGWLVIDGCGPKKFLPVLEMLRRYRAPGEPIDALILTHPHADHYQGIVDLLDDGALGPAVRRIGCVAEYVGQRTSLAADGSSLDVERDLLERAPPTNDPLVETELGRARTVLNRIRTEWKDRPERQLYLRHGASIPLRTREVTAQVLWPEPSVVQRFFTVDAALRARVVHEANRLSAVLDIRFQQTRLLLTGDLVHADAGGKVLVGEGWERLHALVLGLHAHHALKVPHHGSREALTDELLQGVAGFSRTWVVTPFNSQALPSPEPGEGAELLLQKEREFLLTALSVGWKQQISGQVRLTLAELRRDVLALKGAPGFLSSATRAGSPKTVPPSECCWGMAFDEAGHLLARYRGQGARIIQRPPVAARPSEANAAVQPD
jgi:hypothetical protein